MKKLIFLMMFFGIVVVSTGSASAQPNEWAKRGCLMKDTYVGVWDGQNYVGACFVFGIGEHPTVIVTRNGSPVLGDNTISSIKVGANVKALICRDANFKGGCEIIEADTPSMRNLKTIKDNEVSSIKIVPKSTPNEKLLGEGNDSTDKQKSNVTPAAKLPVTAGSGLKKDVKYASPSGNHYLVLQGDGNMIIKNRNNDYIWGLDQLKKNSADRVEIGQDGSLTAYDKQGKAIWSPQTKRDPSAKLNLSFDGALQLVAANGDILWSSDGNLIKPINVFATKPNVKNCAEPGWAKCIELTNPNIKIMGSSLVNLATMHAVANVYTEITNRFGPKYPKITFDGFKVYMTNGEPGNQLGKMKPLDTFGEEGMGKNSRNWLRGGANADFIWISEQMICKQGVKTRLRDYPSEPDNTLRKFDQVIHEFGHAIEGRYKMEQRVNNIFRGAKMTPKEAFPYAIQHWFAAPTDTLPPSHEALMKELFTSRTAFSCEGSKP